MSENLETGVWNRTDLNRRPYSAESAGRFAAFFAQFRRILGLRELVRHQFVEARATAVYTAPGKMGATGFVGRTERTWTSKSEDCPWNNQVPRREPKRP